MERKIQSEEDHEYPSPQLMVGKKKSHNNPMFAFSLI